MSTLQNTLNEQDPDYESSAPNNETQQKAFQQNARCHTARKLREIFDKEFNKEIDTKRKEVLEIQDRIQKSLKTLHLLRYFIVTDYYNNKNCQPTEVQADSKQTRIHPAIKQLIGKCPKGIETNFIEGESPVICKQPIEHDSVKLDTTKDKCTNESEKETKSGTKRSHEDDPEAKELPKKIPRYIPPKSSSPEPALPSRGVHNKIRRRIIVGNISKWIPTEWRDDAASHKWTIYVRSNKDEVDISEFVSKVRFFLHPTYKPHDVVEITSSPFHLTRRGWGEFRVRIQLHFKNPLNKPTEVIHDLKLDQTYTGLQTLGSESVYDIWLQSINSHSTSQVSETKDQVKQKHNYLVEDTEKLTNVKNKTLDNSIQNNADSQIETNNAEVKSLKICIRNEHNYALMDYVVENNRTIVHIPNESEELLKIRRNCEQAIKNTEINGIPQINGTEQMSEEELAVVVSNANRPTNNAQTISSLVTNLKNYPAKMKPLNISIPPNFEVKKKRLLVLKNNKLMPINSVNVSKSATDKSTDDNIKNNLSIKSDTIKETNNSKSILLSAKNTFIYNTDLNIPALQIAEGFKENGQKNGINTDLDGILNNKDKKMKPNGKDRLKVTKKDIWEETMRRIHNYEYTDTVSLVKFIMQRVPLITEEASDPEYKKLHPYTCASLNEYLGYNVGKQKYLEWSRAKVVRSFMKKLIASNEDLWTMKEIMIWARQHGYTPVIHNTCSLKRASVKNAAKEPSCGSTMSCTQMELLELEDWFIKCENETDSYLDEEIDIESMPKDDLTSKKFASSRNSSHMISEEDNADFLELPDELQPLHSFILKASKRCGGMKLNNEAIAPGIKYCAASHVLIQAVKCLVGDISRLAHAKSIERISKDNSHNIIPPIITESDVKDALSMREEFDIFTNVGLGTKQESMDWNLLNFKLRNFV